MKNLFLVPGKPAALPMRDWGAKEGDFTWEDWHETAKKEYPVRYFMSHTIPKLWNKYITHNKVVKFVQTIPYWIRAHTINRYHMLNMSSPNFSYTWGWMDRSELMLIAPFNILREYMEKELQVSKYHSLHITMPPYDPDYGMNEKEFTECFSQVVERDQEIQTLYDWWMTGRMAEHDAHDKADAGLGNGITVRDELLWEAWQTEEKRLDVKDDEMLARLIKIRGYLWT